MSLNNIGVVYKNQGKLTDALRYYYQALEMRKKTLPLNHTDIAKSLANIGVVLKTQEKYNDSLRYFRQSLEIFNKSGNNDLAVASALNNIGSVYLSQGFNTFYVLYQQKQLINYRIILALYKI